jgi:uncharacterized membrane protein YbhN (UPF0104 family)
MTVLRDHISADLFDELHLARLGSIRRGYLVGIGVAVAAGLAVAVLGIGRVAVGTAVTDLARAQPGWLFAAAVFFAAGLLCSAAAWQSGLRACGGTASFTQVSARYAIGSLVNSVTPAHIGGAVRLGLLSRTLPGEDRVWRVCGVGGSVAAARTLALAAMVVAAAAIGNVPLWPAPLLAVAVFLALAFGVRTSERAAGHLRSLLEIFRRIARAPRAGVRILVWVGCSFGARLGAATAIALALGVPRPVFVAIVLIAAMSLAGLLPMTPGNFGAGAGAATLALHGTGVGIGASLALGVAFQAVETFAGMTLGLGGAAVLAAPGTAARKWSLATAGAGAVIVAAALGFASVDLV